METARWSGGWHWWLSESVPAVGRRPDTSPIAIFRSRCLARIRNSHARATSPKMPERPPPEMPRQALPRYRVRAGRFAVTAGLGPSLHKAERSASAETRAESKAPAAPHFQNRGRAAGGFRIVRSRWPRAAQSQRVRSPASNRPPEKQSPALPATRRPSRLAKCSSVGAHAPPEISPGQPSRSRRRPTIQFGPLAGQNASQKNKPASPPESKKQLAAAADAPPNRQVPRPAFLERTAESTRSGP